MRELDKVGRHIQQIIDAVKEGMRSASMAAEIEQLDARKAVLEQELAGQPEPPPRLHPRLVDVYRRKVSDLAVALNAEETRAEAADIVRSSVDEVRLAPEADKTLGIVLVGALAGILALTNERPRGKTTGAQLTMVAGACNYRRSQVQVEV